MEKKSGIIIRHVYMYVRTVAREMRAVHQIHNIGLIHIVR